MDEDKPLPPPPLVLSGWSPVFKTCTKAQTCQTPQMDEDEPLRPAPAGPEWMLWLTEQLALDEEQASGRGGG